ncbi:MAG: benzoyl-CoA 2,3-epoxidase subunit BoxA [Rhodospirillales bacterium]
MSNPIKQHLIDPEICIRCYTCEMTCPVQAIQHDANNVVVDASRCNFCMDCIPVCPTGSIDEWRVVSMPYSLDVQYAWQELPDQEEIGGAANGQVEALDEAMAELLLNAHEGAGGKSKPPASAPKASVNLYNLAKPATAKVQGSYRLTAKDADSDVRHIILDFGAQPFPVLEGQSIGVIPPGIDAKSGKAYLPRLYSVSSPRDGERPNYNNVSLTVKREPGGICSNYLCDLEKGDEVHVTGPFGSTFLMPDDPSVRLLMICTGTGAAPFRAFTMRRQRTAVSARGDMVLLFGARTPDTLPYFGPLKKVPDTLLQKHLVFSRIKGVPREYVQDRMLIEKATIAELLDDPKTHIYICGLREMEEGVGAAFEEISAESGQSWTQVRDTMREDGRYHVETY